MPTNTTSRSGLLSEDAMAVDNTAFLDLDLGLGTWARNGSPDTNDRASVIGTKRLEDYEQPPLDDGIREELERHVVGRPAELDD